MYKGYRVIRKERVVHVVDKDGTVRGCVTPTYAEGKKEKDLVTKVMNRLEPKRPKTRIDIFCVGESLDPESRTMCFCPECGWQLGQMEDEQKYHSCPQCGQVIDWKGAKT